MPFVRFGSPGLFGTMARTADVAGPATMTANALNRQGAGRAEQAQAAQAYEAEQQPVAPQAAYGAPPLAAPQGGSSGGDLVDGLAELAKLRDSGALTPDEFESAKAKLLG